MNSRTGEGPKLIRLLLDAGASQDGRNKAGVSVRTVADRMGVTLPLE